jgi:hypothetical protein
MQPGNRLFLVAILAYEVSQKAVIESNWSRSNTMTDIFISYKREDRAKVETLAQDLKAEGFEVWWDTDLAIGTSYSKSISQELETAKAVVVVWTKSSISSDWVQEEATRGKQRNVLVPVRLDVVEPPIGFGMFQTADLSNRIPHDSRHDEWLRLIGRLHDLTLVTAKPGPGIVQDVKPRDNPGSEQKPKLTRRLAVATVGALPVGALAYLFWRPRSDNAQLNFGGIWKVSSDKRWGYRMEFHQYGTKVAGSYVVDEVSSPGEIEGKVIADVFNFTWKSADGNYAGDGNLTLSPDGNSFHGNYRVLSGKETLTPDLFEGTWSGVRNQSLSE